MSSKKLKVRKRGPAPGSHHLDRRADQIITNEIEAPDDELLTTQQVANWLGVSTQWLEIGRSKNRGPKFTRVGPKMVRYARRDIRRWLKARVHASTAEYSTRKPAQV
jgi:predicted DNA-binding transcriptional regulator AlpA